MNITGHIKDALSKRMGVTVEVTGNPGLDMDKLPEHIQRTLAATVIEAAAGNLTGPIMVGLKADGSVHTKQIDDAMADFLRIKDFVDTICTGGELSTEEIQDFTMLAVGAMPSYIEAVDKGTELVAQDAAMRKILRAALAVLLNVQAMAKSQEPIERKVAFIEHTISGFSSGLLKEALDKLK
jgi:hypothetical protein